jgi:hypothetical protein
MAWKFADEVDPPARTDVLVWNGEHLSIAKFKRGRFIAQAEGIDVRDPWEQPLEIKGVIKWAPVREPA